MGHLNVFIPCISHKQLIKPSTGNKFIAYIFSSRTGKIQIPLSGVEKGLTLWIGILLYLNKIDRVTEHMRCRP